jgi:hypothetical protein
VADCDERKGEGGRGKENDDKGQTGCVGRRGRLAAGYARLWGCLNSALYAVVMTTFRH